MSEHDDIQLDEETLRQIEEEARLAVEAELESGGDLKRQLEEQAMRETGGDPTPVQEETYEEADDDDEEWDESDESGEAEPRARVRSAAPQNDDSERIAGNSSIELLEMEIEKKSGTFKVAVIIMIAILVLGGLGVYGIIRMNKNRSEKAATAAPVKAGGRKKAGNENKERDKQARQLFSKSRAMSMRKNPVAYQIEDGLKFIAQLKKEYPEFYEQNTSAVDDTEKTLLKKQELLKNMMNMGR